MSKKVNLNILKLLKRLIGPKKDTVLVEDAYEKLSERNSIYF